MTPKAPKFPIENTLSSNTYFPLNSPLLDVDLSTDVAISSLPLNIEPISIGLSYDVP